MVMATDENGIATFELEAATYKAKLPSVPVGYKLDQEYFYFAGDSKELTITLAIQTYTYLVKVMDEDGNPVADVDLKFVKSEGEFTYATDAEGKRDMMDIKNDYTVTVESAPAAYAPDTTEYTFPEAPSEDNVFELVITLKPAA